MATKSESVARYRIGGRGLDWTAADGSPRRAEPGDLVDDLPADSIPGLLGDGLITKDED